MSTKHYLPSLDAIKQAIDNGKIVYFKNVNHRVEKDMFGILIVINMKTNECVMLQEKHYTNCFMVKKV